MVSLYTSSAATTPEVPSARELELQRILVEFDSDPGRTEYTFPATLDARDRYLVHEVSTRSLSVDHRSDGIKESLYKERRLRGFVVTNYAWCPVCNTWLAMYNCDVYVFVERYVISASSRSKTIRMRVLLCDDAGCDGFATCTSSITYGSLCGTTKNVSKRKIGVNLLVSSFDGRWMKDVERPFTSCVM